ncbi:MAG: ankyrin repeat domain-containing protein, partial [Desulfobacterales bacterium]|nr:ankyrin repeat domain-containing protein [Desulfobacterales bacterium]
MKYCSWFILLLVLFMPQISFAAPPLSGSETAKLLADELSRVFDIHFKSDTSLLEGGGHFTNIVLDEEKEQIRFESRAFLEATGKKLSCTVGKDRAEITLPETWDDAANDVAGKVLGPLALFQEQRVGESGVEAVFRSAALEFEKKYYVIVFRAQGEKTNPVITLGYYIKDRTREVQVFSEPRSVWKGGKSPQGYRAKVTMQRYKKGLGDVFGAHVLEVRFNSGTPELVFTPDLYPMWPDRGPGHGKYIKEITNVRIDRTDLPWSGQGRLYTDPVQRFSVIPGKEGMARMEKGKSISFDLVTTLDERVRVIFPLKNFQKTVSGIAMVTELSRVSPLLGMVALKDYQGVRQAIAGGADVNLSSKDKLTALGIAVKMEDPAMIRILGTAENLDTEAKNRAGDGYLHTTVHYQRGTEVLQALLEIGCDPDMKDAEGRTPLSRTVCYKGFGKIEILLNSGADIDNRDNRGYTPLHHTVRNRFASPEETAFFLRAGADGNIRTAEGNTPLMVAVNNQCWGHIQALVKGGVNLKAKSKAGLTAVDLARKFRDSKDLSEHIPTLKLQGGEAVRKTREAYKNLVIFLENKSLYHYGFSNTTDETVYLALRILGSDNQWTTKYWAELEPGEKRILARSSNRI